MDVGDLAPPVEHRIESRAGISDLFTSHAVAASVGGSDGIRYPLRTMPGYEDL